MNIVLIGFMGTGKSAAGRALSYLTQMRWVDTDAEIERTHGRSVREIFSLEGEPAFRHAETKVLQNLAAEPQGMVVSTGGGTPLREENVYLLRQIGTIILLTASASQILARVGHNLAERPLLAHAQNDPLRRIQDLLAEREPQYRAAAHYCLDTGLWKTPEAVAVQALKLINYA